MRERPTGSFEIERALVVDSDGATVELLRHDTTLDYVDMIDEAPSCLEAHALLRRQPDLILMDVADTDFETSARFVTEASSLPSAPVILLMGDGADAHVVVELIRCGADGFITKPVTLDQVRRGAALIGDGVEQCDRMARQLVGRIGLKDAIQRLRGAMNNEALSRTGGSRRAAAALLGVHRRYVQRIIVEFEGTPDHLRVTAQRDDAA